MKTLGRMFLVILLLILVGTALNISNSAINDLTVQNREAVIGADYNNEEISFFLFGQSYEYDMDELHDAAKLTGYKLARIETVVVNHFVKCYRIFRAVFL